MIKALFLIFEPGPAWNRVALSRRSLGLTVVLYLLPMMLIVAAAEGVGLVEWGRLQSGVVGIKRFTPGEALIIEMLQLLLMSVILVVSAHLIKSLGETFHGRHTYQQAFTVVIYGLSPMFLLRLLDVFPTMNLWIPWGLGILLTVKVLYEGVPRIMLPDPPHAFGLYLMSCLLLTMVTAVERFVIIGYLTGWFKPFGDLVTRLAAHLPFGK
jgi:Yip1 domain